MKRLPDKKKGRAGARPGPAAQAGFTLMEVVVAVVILGLAYVAVLQNFSTSIRNILRLDEGRSALHEESLLFEEYLRVTEEEDSAGESLEGALFLEGQRYQVILVESENQEFMTLAVVRPLAGRADGHRNR